MNTLLSISFHQHLHNHTFQLFSMCTLNYKTQLRNTFSSPLSSCHSQSSRPVFVSPITLLSLCSCSLPGGCIQSAVGIHLDEWIIQAGQQRRRPVRPHSLHHWNWVTLFRCNTQPLPVKQRSQHQSSHPYHTEEQDVFVFLMKKKHLAPVWVIKITVQKEECVIPHLCLTLFLPYLHVQLV